MSDWRNLPAQPHSRDVTKTPSSARRSLTFRASHIAHLERMIESNELLIEAFETGRITGISYGAGPSDPRSVSEEIQRLRKQNEEHLSLVRLEKALDRRNEAHTALSRQWLPYGNGFPTMDSLREVDHAEQDVRVAKADIDHIAAEILAGLR